MPKQEEVLNPEDISGENQKNIDEVTKQLHEIAENVENGGAEKSEDNPKEKATSDKKVSRRGFLGSMLKTAAGIGIGSAIMGKEGESVAEGAEKNETPEEKENRKNNIEFLRGVFQRISGGGMGRAENGNLVVHIGGGHYYELKNSDLGKLTDIAGNYRERMERAGKSKSMKTFALKIREAGDMAIKANIIKLGQEAKELPESLGSYEKARKEVVEEMQESPVSGKKKLRSQKATSSEAGEFLN